MTLQPKLDDQTFDNQARECKQWFSVIEEAATRTQQSKQERNTSAIEENELF
jgi:hypothetical protein